MGKMTKRLICTDESKWDDEMRLEIGVEDSIEELHINKDLFESLIGVKVGNGICIEIDIKDVTEQRKEMARKLIEKLRKRTVWPDDMVE